MRVGTEEIVTEQPDEAEARDGLPGQLDGQAGWRGDYRVILSSSWLAGSAQVTESRPASGLSRRISRQYRSL
jgi:hypothetical protein